MYIDTHSRAAMEHSICDYLGVTKVELLTIFDIASKAAQREYYLDGDKLNQVINDFIDSYMPSTPIDQILFFHLTRRLNAAQNSFVGTNLANLLTTENTMSDFLKKHDVEFLLNNGHLDLFYKGSLVSLERTYEENVPYLRSRFGYNKGREDFCFNGFLLKDLLYKNSYARELSDVPEFIGVLATFLKRRDIGTDYYENSTYYCFEYCIPIEKVLFDNDEKLSYAEKQKYLINQILHRLYDYSVTENRYMFDHDNPVLRLADDDMMEEEYFVSSEEVTAEMLRQ